MRNIVLILCLIWGCWGCSDEKGRIFVDLPQEAFTFRPIAGGAVMHYILPDDPDIVGVNVRYKNARGEDMLRVGSVTCDSLKLIGFDEAVVNVPAEVTLYYCDDRESQPIEIAFSTLDSGPVAFLKNVEVVSNWGGFVLKFSNAAETSGMAHVYYLGIDPITQLEDTIRIESFTLQETDGEQYVPYKLQQTDIENPTIIIRAEDYRGYMLPERIWENVQFLEMKKLDPQYFTFYCDNSIEDDKIDMLGVKYLFDGDTKGLIQWDYPGKCYSFIAGPDAAGDAAHPMYIDLKEDRTLGEFRIYTMLLHANSPTFGDLRINDFSMPSGVIYIYNENEMPREITLYGLPDDGATPATYEELNALENWEEIGHFEQELSTTPKDRWCYGCSSDYGHYPFSREELMAAEDRYLYISIPATGEQYRYLKIVINEVFNLSGYLDTYSRNYANTKNYVNFHELEIYTD